MRLTFLLSAELDIQRAYERLENYSGEKEAMP